MIFGVVQQASASRFARMEDTVLDELWDASGEDIFAERP